MELEQCKQELIKRGVKVDNISESTFDFCVKDSLILDRVRYLIPIR